MFKLNFDNFTLQIEIKKSALKSWVRFVNRHAFWGFFVLLSAVSVYAYLFYYRNGLGLAYNDARSHLDIGRRVVEGLKPGLAQLGSVWLPLPHLLMIPTVWNDFMWHSGLSGALESMISFVVTGLLIYIFLKKLGVGLLGRFIGVLVFAANLNVLYLQSTAMTELLLLATMTLGVYELVMWHVRDEILHLIKASFWIMLSTLVRYDGWFLFLVAGMLVVFHAFKKSGYKASEAIFLFFATLGGLGIALWFLWNQAIFHDALYFAFGPYSARMQQAQLEQAGVLATKGNLLLSLKVYIHALAYNSGAFTVVLGILGALVLLRDKTVRMGVRIAITALFAPFFFNILALYLGHSVLFVQGISGDTWFNVRYGVMMMPSIAIFVGYLVHRAQSLKYVVIGLFLLTTFFSFVNSDAVTIDDARVGSSQKNVSEVSGWLAKNVKDQKGFILISAASHDAIIFSSGLPMKRFIHEGTGLYWENATVMPDRWAKWIVMRTNDNNDSTFRLVKNSPGFKAYNLVDSYPFADIYELKPGYLGELNTEPVFGRQK